MAPTELKTIRHYNVQMCTKEGGWSQPIRVRADCLKEEGSGPRELRVTEFILGGIVVAKVRTSSIHAWWVEESTPSD